MSNLEVKQTKLKAVASSTNFWTGIFTVITAAFSYFLISPDFSSAEVLAGEAQKAVDAINTKNYIALFSVLVNAGNILYHLFKK
jgi:mannitol-specific phosphotransferase system IIBC component